jgi:hypothetical protein
MEPFWSFIFSDILFVVGCCWRQTDQCVHLVAPCVYGRNFVLNTLLKQKYMVNWKGLTVLESA